MKDFYEQLWWWDLLLHGSSAVVIGLIGYYYVRHGGKFVVAIAASKN